MEEQKEPIKATRKRRVLLRVALADVTQKLAVSESKKGFWQAIAIAEMIAIVILALIKA